MAPSQSASENRRGRLPPVRGWFIVVVFLTVAAGYLYHLNLKDREFFLNSFHFRTLQEVASAFNNNLEQLVRLHEYEESRATISTIFPSYTEIDDGGTTLPSPGDADALDIGDTRYSFTLEANRLRIERTSRNPLTAEEDRSEPGVAVDVESFSVDIVDVLPEPRQHFALYLIADVNNNVLSSTAAMSGLSMIDTRAVTRAIQLRENQDWSQLAKQGGIPTPDPDKPLPGHSAYVDMELTTGKSRLFILPFLLHHSVGVPGAEKKGGVALYLVGVQPEQVIEDYESRRWNLSLLLLSLVLLVAAWTGARLMMLSRHQPIGNYFYRTTVVASYLTFLLLVALLLAFAQRQAAVADREALARGIMAEMRDGVERDLYAIVSALEPYHGLFDELLTCARERSVRGRAQAAPSANGKASTGQPLVVGSEEDLKIRFYDDIVDFLCGAPDDLIGSPAAGRSDSVELPPFSELNVYGPATRVALDDRKQSLSEWFEVEDVSALPGDGRLLSVFLMNEEAWQVLPTFFYYETNKRPESYHLSHRDYFRRVRDQDAWRLELEGPAGGASPERGGVTVSSVYIQRLLNINTGTRGSTLGMPLRRGGGACEDGGNEACYILGSDIVIPSLSLTRWDRPAPPQDLAVMVIDRESGQVLYHMDADRSMVENLYQSGRGTANISQRVRSGLATDRAVAGHYHGERGRFLAADLPVSQWAIVVFVPDASTDSLMTNAFLTNAGGMAALLLLLAGIIYFWRRRAHDDAPGSRLPAAGVGGDSLLLFSAVLVSGVYLAFRLGAVLERQGALPGATTWSVVLALVAALLWVYRELRRLRQAVGEQAPAGRGPRRDMSLLVVLAIAGLGTWAYLAWVGSKPEAALAWYYGNLQEARLNREREELHDVAMTRFPNSIRKHGAEPLSLLPLACDWRRLLAGDCLPQRDGGARHRRPFISPEDVGTFSRYTSTTDPYDWVLRYLLNLAPAPPPGDCAAGAADGHGNPAACPSAGTAGGAVAANRGTASFPRFSAAIVAAYLLLCALWYRAHNAVITARLTGNPGLLEHLRYIIARNVPARAYAPRSELVLDLQCRRYAGDDLTALLHRYGGDAAASGASAPVAGAGATASGMALLLNECPWLRPRDDGAERFPGANISFAYSAETRSRERDSGDDRRALEVHLSDLDACLSRAGSREALLRLVRALKILCLNGKVAGLRLSLDFHSYEALLLKAHNTRSDRDPLGGAELADWAETLTDFTVELPPELTSELDPAFLRHECAGSNLLRELPAEVPGVRSAIAPRGRRQRRWLRLRDAGKTSREWATINFILLKAGALFRHKWETCSGAEKLALYNLARQRRINTANGQLLEQLALQGLIRVDRDRIRIVNNSLAYFARHAEDTDALRELVEIGEGGVWQQYRLPVTLVILIVLAGIALTSGSSLYLIAASLLGLLGTVGSLTSSAQMIRENLR